MEMEMRYITVMTTVTSAALLLLSGSVSGGNYCPSNTYAVGNALYCPQPGQTDDYTVCCRKNGIYYCCSTKLLAAILGGVFGTLALIGIIVLLVCCIKVKRGDWVCVKVGPSRMTLITKSKLEKLQRQKAQIDANRMQMAMQYARYGIDNPQMATQDGSILQMAPVHGNNPQMAPEAGNNPQMAPEVGNNPQMAPVPGNNPQMAPEPENNPQMAPEAGNNPQMAPPSEHNSLRASDSELGSYGENQQKANSELGSEKSQGHDHSWKSEKGSKY